MKKYLLISTLFLAIVFTAKSQEEFKPSGAGIAAVFFNYKYDLTKDVNQKSAFEIERAYLGYKYNFSNSISGKVVFDIGYDATVKTFAVFAKNANIDWTIHPFVKLSAGMIGLRQFDTQEKYWGYRYIMKTHVDQYGLGTSADLGLNLELPLHKMVTVNLFTVNGDGYKSLQDNFGLHRFGANVIITPVEGLAVKAHYDMLPSKHAKDATTTVDTSTISNLSFFVGYEMKDKFKVGFEYNMLTNGQTYKKYAEDYNLSGISAYATYMLNEKFAFLARYDMLQSNKIGTATDVWNFNKDGALVLAGFQYKPAKGVNLSLNYRTWLYKNTDLENFSGLYVNLGFSI